QLHQHGTPLEPAAEAAMLQEVSNHRASIAAYREQIRQFRIEIEAEQLQVGVGDDRYTRQARLRAEDEAAVQEEHQLGGVSDPAFDALYRRMAHVQTTLDARDAAVQQAADTRAANIRAQVDTETARIQGYQQALTQLETEAEEVVGAVTLHNFQA